MATNIIPAKAYDIVLPWGVYNTKETFNLDKDISNYTTLLIRMGADSNQAAGGGAQYMPVPAFLYKSNPGNQLGCTYYLNGKFYSILVTFPTNTSMKIENIRNITDGNTTMASGIRSIYGIK